MAVCAFTYYYRCTESNYIAVEILYWMCVERGWPDWNALGKCVNGWQLGRLAGGAAVLQQQLEGNRLGA